MHCCAPFVGRLSMLGRFQSLRKRFYLSVLSYQSYVISVGSHFYVNIFVFFILNIIVIRCLLYISSEISLFFVSDNHPQILKYIVLPRPRLLLEEDRNNDIDKQIVEALDPHFPPVPRLLKSNCVRN